MLAKNVKGMLNESGIEVLGNEEYSPGIITIELQQFISSTYIGDKLKANGILVSYESDYLVKRNWIQLALMGNLSMPEINTAFKVLHQMIKKVEHVYSDPLSGK
jgi:aspartate aminotransferase-like enzyme